MTGRALRGRKQDPEVVARRAESIRAFWASLTPEERRARTRDLIKAAHTPEANAKRAEAVRGTKHTPEMRARMSAARRGLKLSREHKAKLSEGLRRRWAKLTPEERRQALRPANKASHSPEATAKKVLAMWKGDAVTYGGAHVRVRRLRGAPRRCEHCGRSDSGTAYEWANLSRAYGDIRDYVRLCRACHSALDRATECGRGHPFDEGNTYWNGDKRQCRTCRRESQRRRQAARKK